MADLATLLVTAENPSIPLGERIAAAHELAKRGDPRLSTEGRAPLRIAGGSFPLGNPPRRAEVGDFAIDPFPVTVSAFRRFIDADGYDERQHWSDDGWAWRMANEVHLPRFWAEPEWEAYLVDNHPVVGVSFYEAEAYAASIGARLPSEAEWERAAAGTDGRAYPWGPVWIEGACGMRGIGPRSTVPIGVFPLNRSADGVRDLVGCVWQWCADSFVGWGGDEPPAEEPFGAERRVTRGGAWNTLQWSVTCHSRNGYPRGARFSNLGFRCAVDVA
jgi:formylglycine-generating enzyme required for sulfatase activity